MRTIIRIHLAILFCFSAAFGQSQSTSTSLAVSPLTQATLGQAFTLTATVFLTSTGGPVTSGKVTFYDAGVPIGVSGTLNSDGVGTFQTAILSSGSHTLSAIYQGGGSFGKSASTGVSRQVVNVASGGFGPRNAGYGTGSAPQEIVQADFNGDGVTDLAVVNLRGNGSGPGTVSVFLGNSGSTAGVGNGTFATPLTLTAGNLPGGIASGDFNEDGYPDLVVSNFQDGTVTVFLWSVLNGNFTAQSPIAVGSGPQKVAVGDFNGDGHIDIIASNGLDNTIGVLLGNGNGTFGSVTAWGGTAGLSNPYGMALGDFNNDGVTDVAIASRNNGLVVVLAGNGSGGFLTTPIATITLPSGAEPQKIIAAPLNSGDTSDLVVGDAAAARVLIIPYKVSVGFGSVVSQATTTTNVYGVGVTDVDGDGILDIVVAGNITGSPNYVEVLRGNGAGGTNFQTTSLSLDPSSDPVALVMGDFNGDGRADIALVDVSLDVLDVSLGQLPATLTLSAPSPNPSTYGQSLTLTANISPAQGPTGTVTFYVDGTQVGSATTLVAGQAQISIAGPTGGNHSITATYSGDSAYAPTTATAVSATVNLAATTTTLLPAPNPSTYGGSVTLTATVTTGATGTVVFYQNAVGQGNVIGSGTLSGGSPNTATASYSGLQPGQTPLYAVYGGDVNYATSTSSAATQTVLNSSTTLLFAAPVDGTVGQTIRLSATVAGTGSATPTGTVTFLNGPTILAGPVSLTNGSAGASVTLGGPAGTTTTFTASYSGDSSFAGSTGTVVVSAGASTTTTVSSVTPASLKFGQQATLTATVSPVPTGITLGQVAFYDGATFLGLANVGSTGSATLTTPMLVQGIGSIRARYSGNGNLASSLSSVWTATVGSAPQQGFNAATRETIGQNTDAVVTGDFNNDGVMDIAVTTINTTPSVSYGVDVLIGNGDGTFQTPSFYSTSGPPVALAVANGEANGGYPDIYVVTAAGLEVLYHADGGFSDSVVLSGVTGGSLAMADFNGDGTDDAVIGSSQGVQFIANYSGTFPTAQNILTTTGAAFVIAADFNGDGKPDIGVIDLGASTNNLIILLGNGDGTFRSPLKTTPAANLLSIATNDFDGDGNPDLALGTGAATVTVMMGNGNGTFQAPLTYPTSNAGLSVFTGDFNGDGKPDVGISDVGVANLEILLNNGNGTFGTATTYPNLDLTSIGAIAVGNFFGGDGRADIVTGYGTSGDIGILLGNLPTPTLNCPSTSTQIPTTVSYNLACSATGGVAPYTYSLYSGALPTGLSLNATTGAVSGTPTAAGTYTFTLNATDSDSPTQHSQAGVTIVVVPVMTLVPSPLTSAVQSAGYSVTLVVGGTSPFTCGISTGALPTGLSLNPSTCVLSGTPSSTGNYAFTVSASDSGSPQQNASQAYSLAVNANTTTTTLLSSQNPATYGQSVTFTATVNATSATGTVAFNEGSTTIGTGTVSSGVATYTTTALSVSTHSITAVYSGDSNYLTSTSTALSQVVNKGSTTTTLTPSNNPLGFGGSLTLTATVSSTLASGTVTFTDANGSFTLGTGTVSGGTATFTTSALAVGQHPITAAYGGDTNFTGSTSSSLTESVTSAVNIFTDNFENGTLISTDTNWSTNTHGLVVPDPLNPSNHVLEFTADQGGGDLFSIPIPNNSANYYLSFDYLYVNPPYGGGFVGVNFPDETWLGGDCGGCYNTYSTALDTQVNELAANQWHHIQIPFPNFNSGSTTFQLKLQQFQAQAPNAFFDNVAISTSGFGLQQLTMTAPPLTTAILGTPWSATLVTGGITPYTCSVSTGTLPAGLTLNPTTCVLSGTPSAVAVSTFTIAAGDSELPAQTASQAYTLAVLQPTVTSLTSSKNPSAVGQPVTFTATVSPSKPTGSVTLYDGTTVIGGPTALSSGSATFAISGLAQGSHAITASYSGDASDTPSTSSLIGSPLNFSSPTAGTIIDSVGNGTGFTSRLSGTGTSITGDDPNLTLNTDGGTLTLQSTDSDLNNQVNLGPAEFIGIPLSDLGIGAGQDFSVTATFRNVQYSQSYDQFGLFAGTASNTVFRGGAAAFPALNVFSVQNQSGQDTLGQASTSLAPAVGDTVTFTLGSTSGNWTLLINNLTNPSISGSIALTQPTFLNGQALTVGVFAENAGNTTSKTETVSSFAIGTPYQLVNLPTQVSSTTTLSSSPNPVDPGQTLTLTATVTPSLATGNVRFLDGATNVGQATLVNGIATLAVSLTSGSHSLTAIYGGDGSYFGSTSAATSETVNQPLTITGSLPAGTVGQSYSASLSASGGSGGYTFHGTLPAGLTLSSGGSISGTPTASSSGSVIVSVSDSAGQSQTTSLPLTITASPISISGNSSLGDVAVGSSVSGSFTGKGGVPPYKWSLSGGGGLGVDSNGNVRGTASSAGVFSPTLTLTDSVGTSATLTLSLGVLGLTGNFPAGTTTSSYSGSASGVGGSGSYTYTGSGIPAGLTFSGGSLTGTASNAGNYTIGVTVTDSGGASVSGSFTISITGPAPATLTITSSSLPDGFVTQPYSQTLTAGGGAPGYTWSQTGGQLPAGLSLSGATVFGTPTTPGSYSFGVKVTDTSGAQALGTISINVQPAPLVFTSGGSLPNGQVTVDYPNQVLTASGGTPPYNFSIKSGSLPAGLNFSNGQISGTPTATGAFGVTVLVTDSAPSPATATLAVSGTINPLSPDLVLGTGGASFAIASGTTGAPAPVTVPVSSTVVSQVLGFSASSSVPWISVGGSTSTPGSVSLSLNSSGLALSAAGSPYSGTVTVTCGTAPCTGNSQTISVSLTVTNSPPQLTLGSPLLSFTASATSPQASSTALGIVNSGGGSLAISSVTAADTWISVGAAPSTVAPGPGASVTITVNPGSLAPGYYLSSVTVNSNAGNSTVPVTLLISASSVMTLGPAGSQFSMAQGGALGNPNGSFLISTATGSINYTANVLPGATWLTAGGSGTATPSSPGTVSFSISQSAAAALPAGAYYGTIEVAGSGIFNSPQEFQVILNVGKAGTRAIPDPEPAGLLFISAAGKSAPSQTLQLFASSVAPIPFQASATPINGSGWLSVTPTAGSTSASAPAAITVNVNASALAAGVYTGTVSFAFATAVRSTNITLIVEAPLTGGSTTSSLAPKANSVCAGGQLVATQTGLVSNFSAPASWPTPMIIQLADTCGNIVNGGQVVTTYSNGDPPLVLSPVDSTTGTYSGTWTPRKTSAQIAIIARASVSGYSSTTVQIAGQVTPNTVPQLAPNGTFDVFHPQTGASLGPGNIVQIYGTGLANLPESPSVLPLPTTVNGTTVLIGGVQAPLYYVSPGQINAQVPFELTAGNQYQVIVSANGALTTPQAIQLSAAVPSVLQFTSGAAVAQHLDGTLILDSSPAQPGEDVVIYLTGLGATDVNVPSGAPSPSSPLANVLDVPVLTLNGTPIPIQFAGLTPTLVGLYQINFQVPSNATTGEYQLAITQDANVSNTTVLSVQQ